MSTTMNDKQQELMDKVLSIKERLLDTYVKNVEHNLDENRVKAFVALADSVENNITKSVKLELMKEKNEIDRNNGNGMIEIFRKIQQEKLERNRIRASEPEKTDVKYEPKGLELTNGELITGQDAIDLETFQNKN